jgi:cell division protein FtsQ
LPSPSRASLKRWARPLLVIGLAAALGGAGFAVHRFFTRSSHFAVRALRFSPTRHVTSESLQARVGQVVGQNLFKLDLDQLARDVREEPWVKEAHARRELPSTVVVDVVEREAALSVALGPVYLADSSGNVFKRATPDEAAALPVVTGVDRDLYLADPDGAKQQIRQAQLALDAWKKNPSRPALGEAHFDHVLGLTVYTVEGSLGIRLGEGELEARLKRFDAVWSALQASGEKARLIYLDNRARPDRVTVKLAPLPASPKKKTTEVVPDGDDDSAKDT